MFLFCGVVLGGRRGEKACLCIHHLLYMNVCSVGFFVCFINARGRWFERGEEAKSLGKYIYIIEKR